MKGKIHGTIDVLAAVISTEKEGDKKARRIDIDTEEFLYHVKVCRFHLPSSRFVLCI